jgi:hypothetical protein
MIAKERNSAEHQAKDKLSKAGKMQRSRWPTT